MWEVMILMNNLQLKKLYALYDEIAYGDGSSAAILAGMAIGNKEFDHELYWEAYSKLREYAASKGEFLDYSEYEDMVVGLPYALQFVKRKIDIILRPLRPEDKDLYIEAAKEEPGCYEVFDSKDYADVIWEMAIEGKRRITYAIVMREVFCGYCNVDLNGAVPEIGIALLYEYQAWGIGKIALEKLMAMTYQCRDIKYFVFRTEASNEYAIKLVTKLGGERIETGECFISKAIRDVEDTDEIMAKVSKYSEEFSSKLLEFKIVFNG